MNRSKQRKRERRGAGPEAGVPTKTRGAGASGQKAGSFRTGTMERQVDAGKGGRVVGKWTGLAHIASASTRLGPDNSMQVVDFPRMYGAGVFGGAKKWVATDGSEFLIFDLRILIVAMIKPDYRTRWTPGILVAITEKTVQLNALKCG